jgi:hypothetical protein
MRDGLAPQSIGNNPPRRTLVAPDQSLAETLRRSSISPGLKIHGNDFSIQIDASKQILLLAIAVHEDVIDEHGVTIASVL